MGLTVLIHECQDVFAFFADLYAAFPYAIKLLILASFGGVLLIAVLRSMWG